MKKLKWWVSLIIVILSFIVVLFFAIRNIIILYSLGPKECKLFLGIFVWLFILISSIIYLAKNEGTS
jgi:hypothetical protein